MRRGTWILAVSGAMALSTGNGFAEEPADSAARRPTGAVPTRYSRDIGPATSRTKNYYDELFGPPAAPAEESKSEEPAPTAQPRPASAPLRTSALPARSPATPTPKPTATSFLLDEDDPFAPAKTKPATAAAKNTPAPTSSKRITADGSKVFPASAESLDQADKNVIQAGFEKQAGTSERSFIQQVRASANQPTRGSAAPIAPTGSDAHTPMITLEWAKRSDINVGQECQVDLMVKNSGTIPASQVAIDVTFPNTVRLMSAEPKPASSTEKLTWAFEVLAPGAEKKIAIKFVPSRRGDLGAGASVRFTGQALSAFKVEEPQLKLAIKGSSEVMLGDPASQLITVMNPGTGVAHDVRLEARISDGLEHREGSRLEIPIGSLGPGDSQQIRLPLSAVKGGLQTVQLAATSSCEASSAASAKINVIAPSLEIAVHGPGLRYKGRNATYSLKVTNDGTVPNSNVRVSHKVPDGFQFVSADKGGKYEASQKTVHWFLGKVDPNQTLQLNCELTPTALGDFRHLVSVNSDSGVEARAQLATRVEGTASLDTSIVDLDDPVEIGSEAAWEVRVRNDGSKAAANLSVACELPAGVELLTAKGPTESVADGKTLLFKSLPQLAPGQQAIYRVHVRGMTEGTLRLRARITSDALDQPVSIEEATKFYADARN